MRVFLALPLPSDAVRSLCAVTEELKRRFRELKVVRPEGLHITLVFLGERSEEEVSALQRLLEKPSLAVPRIHAVMGGYGQFPPQGNPRVLFTPIGEGAGEIASIQRTLVDLLKRAEVHLEEENRRFHAHITLARNKGARIEAASLQDLFAFQERFVFDRLVLFQSLLSPQGAEYKALKTVAFRQD